ncbi:MAG: hypothetical protein Q8N28_02460 [bacterium]|nr:hypothetical protein [bacterium]
MKLIKFFDKLEDKIRANLSHRPWLYALIGSIGIILLWRGIWMIADSLEISGLISAILGVAILSLIGLFISFFIGDQIIISGIKEEKRIDEKTEKEIKKESISLNHIKSDLEEIKNKIDKIRKI